MKNSKLLKISSVLLILFALYLGVTELLVRAGVVGTAGSTGYLRFWGFAAMNDLPGTGWFGIRDEILMAISVVGSFIAGVLGLIASKKTLQSAEGFILIVILLGFRASGWNLLSHIGTAVLILFAIASLLALWKPTQAEVEL